MLSKKAKYALKALFVLAEHGEHQSMMISEIADKESIPKKFLEAILLDLKNHGILYSRRGKTGGYVLGKSPDQISIGQIIRIIDGPLAQIPCASETAFRPCDECKDTTNCSIRIVMRKVRDATAAILDNTTLADAVKKHPEVLNYYI